MTRALPDADHLLVTASSEYHMKSMRTRQWFRKRLLRNLREALDRHAPGSEVVDDGRRLMVAGPDLDAAAAAVARVFGIHRVVEVHPIPERSPEELADVVARETCHEVVGKKFAVRVRRRGGQPWKSPEMAAEIGSRLRPYAAGVDLTNPDVEVKVEAFGDRAYLVRRSWEGPGGLPLGTQARCLGLLSGGFDSPVATWKLMRRGAVVDFVHFRLDCASTDHAMLVAHELWRYWAAGPPPRAWLVELRPVKDAIIRRVEPQFQQIALKYVMMRAADLLAEAEGHVALLTGESVGQVSTQTLEHLALLERATSRPVLRPLAGSDKEEIVAWSRRIGLEDLCARATEPCALPTNRTAIAARPASVEAALRALPPDAVEQAVRARRLVDPATWVPGMEDDEPEPALIG